FGFSTTLNSVVGMACGIIIIRWMAPEELGLWQSVLIIQTWALIFQTGVITGLSRELPFQLGLGQKDYVNELAASALSVALFGLVLLVTAGLIVPWFFDGSRFRLSLMVVFMTSGLTIYQNYLGTTYRANRAFEHLSRIQFADSALALSSLPLVYFWGYSGLVVRVLGMVIINTILRHLMRPIRVRPAFKVKHLASLFRIGAPMFGFGYMLQTVDTFPRLLLLAGENGVLMVGMFAPAAAVLGLMQVLPRSLGSYVFPQMTFKLGSTQSAGALWPMSWKSSVYYLLAALPLVGIGVLLFPWMLRTYFPAYAGSAVAVQWALVAGAFMGTRISINSLYSLKAWHWLAVYTAFNLTATWFLPKLLMATHPPLVAVTMGFATSRVLLFFVGLFCIRRATLVAST
ncbi:MAG: oligosaccharide flippase family protein, partial [Calditrichaeota bacterium]|nr:oligosaccharide flippase family protein [Calditrichota bacterium]